MRRTGVALAALMMVLCGWLAGPAGPASAAPVTCFSGYACLNNNGAYGTRIFLDSPGGGGYGCKYTSARNTADWGSNESSHNLKLWDGDGCTGAYSYLYAGTTGSLGGWSDRINTVQFV